MYCLECLKKLMDIKMSTFRIGFVGECMIELHETQECIKKGFGGDTVNTAIYLSRLNSWQGRVCLGFPQPTFLQWELIPKAAMCCRA